MQVLLSPKCKIIKNMKDYKRTDIAFEKIKEKVIRAFKRGAEISDISVSEKEAEKSGVSAGRYISVSDDSVLNGEKSKYIGIAERLSECIREVLPKMDGRSQAEYLVAGLGNPKLTADSLGSLVVERVIVTRHLENSKKVFGNKLSRVATVSPGVLGVTGIESFDIIKGTLERTGIKCLIVVDSLAAAEFGRLATVFQVSNAGLTPGSGVGNKRFELSQKTLGIEVVTIGVPLVVYASTITAGLIDRLEPKCRVQLHEAVTDKLLNHIVTPKDIDLIVSECADIVAMALNMALHKGLSLEEIATLS